MNYIIDTNYISYKNKKQKFMKKHKWFSKYNFIYIIYIYINVKNWSWINKIIKYLLLHYFILNLC